MHFLLLPEDSGDLQAQVKNRQMLVTAIHQPLVGLREAQHDSALLPVADRLIDDDDLVI